MKRLISLISSGCGLAMMSGWLSSAQGQGAYPVIDTVPKQATSGPVKFTKLKIPNEGTIESAAFGDFNADGILDIVSGNHWFQGPGFQTKRKFRTLSTVDRTTPDDMTVALDVTGDGYAEVVSGGHNYGAFMYLNPGAANSAGDWKRSIIDAARPPDGRVDTVAVASNLAHDLGWHSGGLVDIDGDGKAEEIMNTGVRAPQKLTLRWFKYENGGWKTYDTKQKCEQWGSGIGDLNKDGRPDILCPDAWLQAPADPRSGAWIKNPFRSDICNVASEPEPKFTNSLGFVSGHATQIYAYDVDKDGLNDLILSSGHGNGVHWYRQTQNSQGQMTFQERIIDNTCYQPHNLEFKDISGDGIPDLITGKRWAGWGPNEKAYNYVYWYELIPGAQNPWKRHVISYNEKIGMGTKGDVRDFDLDGDLDVLASSGDAGGTYLFINQNGPTSLFFIAKPEQGESRSAGRSGFRFGAWSFGSGLGNPGGYSAQGRLLMQAEVVHAK